MNPTPLQHAPLPFPTFKISSFCSLNLPQNLLFLAKVIYTQCSAPASRHWSAPTTTRQKRIDFDHEIMENVKKD
jgi:hypothetical protein